MRSPLSNVAMALCSGAVVSVLVYLFYDTALRARVESKLFDLRTRLAPVMVPAAPVVVVTIDQSSIDTLNASVALSPWERADAKDLAPEALLKVLNALTAMAPRAVGVLLPPQIFNYDDTRLDPIAALAQHDHRVLLGTFDQSLIDADHSSPSRLQLTGADRLFKADIRRDFRRASVRSLTLFETDELPYLIGRMYEDLAGKQLPRAAGVSSVELNYAYKDQIAQIPAETVVNDPGAFDLRGAIVLVGYVAYRSANSVNREATFVNTPWQSEGEDVSSGAPVVLVLATGLANLLDHTYLQQAPLWLTIVETSVLSLLALAAWQFNISLACWLFLFGWALLIVFHAFVFSYLHMHVPLADSLLWSALATYSGAFLRLRSEGRWRTAQMAKMRADQQFAAAQDQFLSRFTKELAMLNRRVTKLLKGMVPLVKITGPAAALAHSKALSSSEELRDYLAGMGQVAYLNQTNAAPLRLQLVRLAPCIRGVAKQLETKAQEAKVSMRIDIAEGVTAYCDQTLVAQIMYNLMVNAVQYSPSGSEVVIAAVRTKKVLQLRVADRGVGIAAEYHDRIFEKFYRVKNDFVYKSKGHGLGLYLSRYFAHRMGASVGLESTPGEGSTFTLNLRAGRGV